MIRTFKQATQGLQYNITIHTPVYHTGKKFGNLDIKNSE